MSEEEEEEEKEEEEEEEENNFLSADTVVPTVPVLLTLIFTSFVAL